MLQRLMGFLSGKKFSSKLKKEQGKLKFASSIQEKYTVPERFYGHEPEFIFFKYKIKETKHYHNSVLRQEIIEIRTVKENFLKEQKESRLSSAMEFESFYRLIQKLSYHNWSRLQNVYQEKYTSYPSIVPFEFRSELTRRHLSKEIRYQLDALKSELHSSRELIEKWSKQNQERGAVGSERRETETVYQEERDGRTEERIILYHTDLKMITKYVMQELNDNLTLERMRRGL